MALNELCYVVSQLCSLPLFCIHAFLSHLLHSAKQHLSYICEILSLLKYRGLLPAILYQSPLFIKNYFLFIFYNLLLLHKIIPVRLLALFYRSPMLFMCAYNWHCLVQRWNIVCWLQIVHRQIVFGFTGVWIGAGEELWLCWFCCSRHLPDTAINTQREIIVAQQKHRSYNMHAQWTLLSWQQCLQQMTQPHSQLNFISALKQLIIIFVSRTWCFSVVWTLITSCLFSHAHFTLTFTAVISDPVPDFLNNLLWLYNFEL